MNLYLKIALAFACLTNLLYSENQGNDMANADHKSSHPIVIIKTNVGYFKVELEPEKAPVTVENFLKYARLGFYDGTIFHRVIDGFMVQGGGFTPDLKQKKAGAPIKNEANNGLKNKQATLAMARTSVPDSASSQFFINVVDNDFLDFRSETPTGWGYAVFGKVIEGFDVVKKIAKSKTGNQAGHSDVPLTPVIIEGVEVDTQS